MRPGEFRKSARVLKVDDELGIVYGWAAICSEGGEPYFDTQGDNITEKAAEEACLDFMEHSRIAGDMHEREGGTVPFLLPVTADVGSALGFETNKSGIAIGMKPTDEVLGKFQSGEYTGFSIGGTRIEEDVVEKFRKAEKRKSFRQGRRRRMTKFRLNEISAVDFGAQEGARALLIKRRGEPGYDPKNPDKSKRGRRDDFVDAILKRAFLTDEADGHTHLVVVDFEEGGMARAAGETSWTAGHDHPWVLTAEGELVVGVSNGHTHGRGTLSTTASMASTILAAEDDEMSKALEEKIARLEKIAALPSAQKAHFDGLEGEKADAFLAKSADDRAAELAELEKRKGDDDPIVYTSDAGVVFRKSHDPVLVQMAKDRDEDRKTIKRLEGEVGDRDYTKRAETELGHLPGTPAQRGAALKAIDGIEDEATRQAALDAIKAGNKAMQAAFATAGTSLAPEAMGDVDEIEKRADELQKADPDLSRERAIVKAEDQLSDVAERIRKADGGSSPVGR